MERSRGGRPRHADILTPAEWRVLEELREGGTNAEIAVRLGISPDTVKYHISNMLGKLGVDDRRQLAAWRPEAERRRLRALLAAPLAIGSMARPLAWVGTGAAVLVGVAAVAVGLVVLGDYDDQPVVVPRAATQARESPATLSPTPQPSPAPTPEASPSPEPNPVVTPQPTPIPASTPDPTATPDSRSLSDQPEPDPSRYEAFGPGPPETLTTVLQPGLNLAGWTESDAGVAAIFEAIPELRRVYAWEAAAQWFRWAARTDAGVVGDLTTLLPGMGLWLELGGSEPVSWTRRLIPQTGLADLQEGWNLIVWAGRDGIATTDALSHLEGVVTTALDADSREPATLTKGGAFWLKASTEKQWWQLDEPPRVEFVGDHSPDVRKYIEALTDDVVAYYAKRFGHGVPGLIIRYGDDSIAACAHYGHPAIVMRTGCAPALAHEYAHAVQAYLGGLRGNPPMWLVEGVAQRWWAQYQEAVGGLTEAEHTRSYVLGNARMEQTLLKDLGDRDTLDGDGPLSIALLATDLLASLAGEGALYEFYARRSAYAVWQDAFDAVFGVTLSAFYERFETYRSEVAPQSRVEGVVLGPDGDPQQGVTVRYYVPSINTTFIDTTDRDGRSRWRTGSDFILSLSFDECSLEWSSSDSRFLFLSPDRARVTVDGAGLEGLVLSLSTAPSAACRSIRGRITDLAGNPRARISVTAAPLSSSLDDRFALIPKNCTAADGTFAMKSPRGSYRLTLSDTSCGPFGTFHGYYGGATGLTVRHSRAAPIDARSADVHGLVISYGLIRGAILDPDGEPVEGIRVYTPLHTPIGQYSPPVSDWRGRFQVAVPRGTHTLELECWPTGGGGWYGGERGFTSLEREATPIVLETEDVEGIVINVPFTQAQSRTSWGCPSRVAESPRIEGVVLAVGGQPLEQVRVRLHDTQLSRGGTTALSGADGSFTLSVQSYPDYLSVYLHPGTYCPSRRIGTGEWVEVGWVRGAETFTTPRELPDGVSVEAPHPRNISIVLPAACR